MSAAVHNRVVSRGPGLLIAHCAVLDNQAEHPAQDVETSIDELKHNRESRFAEVTRLFDELKTAQPPTLPAIHVTIRALSRLAAA